MNNTEENDEDKKMDEFINYKNESGLMYIAMKEAIDKSEEQSEIFGMWNEFIQKINHEGINQFSNEWSLNYEDTDSRWNRPWPLIKFEENNILTILPTMQINDQKDKLTD